MQWQIVNKITHFTLVVVITSIKSGYGGIFVIKKKILYTSSSITRIESGRIDIFIIKKKTFYIDSSYKQYRK